MDVLPPAESVTSMALAFVPAVHVQKRLRQGPARVAGLRHDREMSEPKVGQHVTVVIDGTPVLSWHALQYPLGHAMPGEKKEISAVVKPSGRQVV